MFGPLDPLQEKLQELAKGSPREVLKAVEKLPGTVTLFKVDETLRYEVADDLRPFYHDDEWRLPGSSFLTLHYRPREVSKDNQRPSHVEKYYDASVFAATREGLSFSREDALFEPDVLKTHETLKIRSARFENEKDVGYDAVFVALGWLVEVNDGPKIVKHGRVLLTNYVVLLNLTTDPVSMWVRVFAPLFSVESLRVMSQELKC